MGTAQRGGSMEQNASVTRRSVLKGVAGLSLLGGVGGAVAGCDRNQAAFFDIASDALLRDGDIVRLKLGRTRGIPGVLQFGSTAHRDRDVEVTIESTQRRVVFGADN